MATDAHPPPCDTHPPIRWRRRADGSINCETCHPSGEQARKILEMRRLRPPPRYYANPALALRSEASGRDDDHKATD